MQVAARGLDEPARAMRQEEGGDTAPPGDGLGDRALEPARQAVPGMRRQHHEIALVPVDILDQPLDRVDAAEIDLADADAQGVLDALPWHREVEQAPARQRVAHAGKAQDPGLVLDLALHVVDDGEAALGRQRQLQPMREGGGAGLVEIGGVDDALEGLAHARALISIPVEGKDVGRMILPTPHRHFQGGESEGEGVISSMAGKESVTPVTSAAPKYRWGRGEDHLPHILQEAGQRGRRFSTKAASPSPKSSPTAFSTMTSVVNR